MTAAIPTTSTQLQELLTLLYNHLGSIILIAVGSALTFAAGRARDAMFVSIQSRIKKNSRLRPGTAAGHQTVNQELHDLRKSIGAFRVSICQFHNGDNFMLANHSWKVSCTHESLDPGARATFREMQSLPISHMSDWVGPIVDSDLKVRGVGEMKLETADHKIRAVTFDVDEMDMSTAKLLATDQGVGFALAVGLVDPNRKATFGFVIVHLQDCWDAKMEELNAKLPDIAAVTNRVQFFLTDDFKSFDRKGIIARIIAFLFRR